MPQFSLLRIVVPVPAANILQIENDDYCAACSGNGDLICCDSCSKSFHFECVDLVGSAELPDDWFCNDCIYKRAAQRPDHKGPFGPLLNMLEKTIPRAFSLPKKVQAYFEDIKAGVNGEYEEIDRTKTSKYVESLCGRLDLMLTSLQEGEESRVRLVPAEGCRRQRDLVPRLPQGGGAQQAHPPVLGVSPVVAPGLPRHARGAPA